MGFGREKGGGSLPLGEVRDCFLIFLFFLSGGEGKRESRGEFEFGEGGVREGRGGSSAASSLGASYATVAISPDCVFPRKKHQCRMRLKVIRVFYQRRST